MGLDIFNQKKKRQLKDLEMSLDVPLPTVPYLLPVKKCLNKITNADMPPTSLDTCSPTPALKISIIDLIHGKVIQRKMFI